MGITKRFILILLVGVLLLAASIYIHNTLSIFLFYNLILAVLLFIDYFISTKSEDIEVQRCGNDMLSIYEKEAICIELYNKSDTRLHVELKDEIPEFHFICENKLMKGVIEPHEKKLFEYVVEPTKRGAYSFGDVYIKCKGRLGLCTKFFKYKQKKEYRVYPNLKNLKKYRLSICNNRAYKQGQKNLRMLGKGTAFESLREYVAGDEYRKINWKATARENKPIVNQYEPEKNQHVYSFIDIGRPMSYTVRGHRKLDLVVNTALLLSDIVNQNGDQSGLLLFNTDVNSMIMPGKGPEHRNKILEALYHIDHSKQTSNYDEAFYYFKRKERHRSIIFVFTDFDTVEEAENMLRLLPIISKNNLVVIMLIRDERLLDMAAAAVKNQDELFNKGVALQLLNERKRIISLLNKRGVFCIECPSEKLEFTAINKYIQIKNRTYM